MAEQAEKKVQESIDEETGEVSQSAPEDPRPRLVVDVTLSMAGYIAPPGTVASDFSRTLEDVASALPQHDLFVFGAEEIDRRAASLGNLLQNRDAGLGREFASDWLFRGPNNQDDLLFQAIGGERPRRPLVLFTDGVYSSPRGQGVQPVARALDELIQRDWSVGVIALRSAYYGTRCELVPGMRCGGDRLFYSEASTQKGDPGFIALPCPVIRNRPFYLVVISPTSEIFKSLYSMLDKKFRVEAGFLLAGDASMVKLQEQILPAADKNEEQPEIPEIYDSLDSLRWLMFDKSAGSQPGIEVKYSVDPRFPVESIRWTVKADQTTWVDSGFGPWTPVEDVRVEADPQIQTSIGTPAPRLPERLQWRSFAGDLVALKASFSRQIEMLGDGAGQHRNTVDAVQAWQPDARVREQLYCEYLDLPSRMASSRAMSMLRILLTADALRRQQPNEVQPFLGPLLLAAPSSRDADLAALARYLAVSHGSQPQATTLAAATAVTVPAGRPTPVEPHASEAAPDEAGAEAWKALRLRFPDANASRTYKLRLVPQVLATSRSLELLSTSDDSDLAFVDRTYRLESLLRYLATAQLARMGERGHFTVYVTIPVD